MTAMRPRGRPTRLELHRLKYNQSGRRGPLLSVKELAPEEKDLLNREVAMDARVKDLNFCGEIDEQVYDEVQSQVFSSWGVMCPHNTLLATDVGFECQLCGAALLPNFQLTSRRIASKKGIQNK